MLECIKIIYKANPTESATTILTTSSLKYKHQEILVIVNKYYEKYKTLS
jgi:hypothetical protein